MDTVAIFLIVMAAFVLMALMAFAVIKTRASRPAPQIPHTHASNVPGYTHDPRHMEYYRPEIAHEQKAPEKDEPGRHDDPKKRPLPRCPSCGAATGYDDERCHKCGLSLREIP